MNRFLCVCIIVFASLPASVYAADTPVTFADPADRARYDRLLEELRCLVCQNQSLADSHAELAQDLRNEVYGQINAGANDAAIRRFMVDRYGDFVLYKPPVNFATLALWFGPGVLLVIAIGIVAGFSRTRRRDTAPLTADERERARHLLDGDDGA